MSHSDTFLFGVFPYLAFAVGLIGSVLRFRGARDTVSSRSSQLLEGKLLYWGSVPWHEAILPILTAHLLALLIPRTWGALLGVPWRLYALEVTGVALGTWAFIALAVLLVRRVRLRAASSAMDFVVLLLLALQVGTGVVTAFTLRWGSAWYLHTAVPWLVSLAKLEPRIEYAALLPTVVKVHAVGAFLLWAVFPFSRLTHAAVFPVTFLSRAPQLVVWRAARGGDAPR